VIAALADRLRTAPQEFVPSLREDGAAWTPGIARPPRPGSLCLLVRLPRAAPPGKGAEAQVVARVRSVVSFPLLRDVSIPPLWRPPDLTAAELLRGVLASRDPAKSALVLPAEAAALSRGSAAEALQALRALGAVSQDEGRRRGAPAAVSPDPSTTPQQQLIRLIASATASEIRATGALPQLYEPLSVVHTSRQPAPGMVLLPRAEAEAVVASREAGAARPGAVGSSAAPKGPAAVPGGAAAPHEDEEDTAIGWQLARRSATVPAVSPGVLAAASATVAGALEKLPTVTELHGRLRGRTRAAMALLLSMGRLRPVWPLCSLRSVIGQLALKRLRDLLARSGVWVQRGAFRECVVAHGADPASDPAMAPYQCLDKRTMWAPTVARKVVEAARKAAAATTPPAAPARDPSPTSPQPPAAAAPPRHIEDMPFALAGAASAVLSDKTDSCLPRVRVIVPVLDVAEPLLGVRPGPLHPAATADASPGEISLAALVYGAGQAAAPQGAPPAVFAAVPAPRRLSEAELRSALRVSPERLRRLVAVSHPDFVRATAAALPAERWVGATSGWLSDSAAALLAEQYGQLMEASVGAFAASVGVELERQARFPARVTMQALRAAGSGGRGGRVKRRRDEDSVEEPASELAALATPAAELAAPLAKAARLGDDGGTTFDVAGALREGMRPSGVP